MDYRQGTCGSCKSSFRVPASFTANKAKCPKCGGVVELGAAQTASAAAAPEKPRPVPASVPTARPTAPAPATAPTSKPAAAAATKSPAAATAAHKPAAPVASKPAPAASARPAAVKPATAGGKDSVRAAAEAAAHRVRSGASAAKSTETEPAEPKPRERLGRERASMKKKSWGPTIIAAVFLVALVAGAGWYFVWGGDDSSGAAQPANATANATAKPAAPVAPVAEAPAPETPLDAAPPAEEAPPPVAEKPAEKPAEKALVDDIDLLALAEQPKLAETSDADWAQIVDWANTFTDPLAGAAGNRARTKLLAKGKEAFPALLNEFRLLDVTTDDGYRTGDLIQKLLMEICHGNNFGWYYSTELKDVINNKKVVRLWFVSWEQARDNDKAWAKLAKLDQQKPAEGEAEPAAAPPKKKDDLEDF